MNDFMGGMFDSNGNGRTDIGEEYTAFRIHEDMAGNKTDSLPRKNTRRSGKLDGFSIFIILLLAYQIFCWIADAIY